MKLDKVISLTIFNSLGLFIFASLLSSCQKTTIKSSGYFTSYGQIKMGRTIASVGSSKVTSFKKHFDFKQVFVYCKLNEVNFKDCFKQNTNRIIQQYESQEGKLTEEEKMLLSSNLQLEKVKNETHNIVDNIILEMAPHITQLIAKRENFWLRKNFCLFSCAAFLLFLR